MVITNETVEYRPPRNKGPIIAAAIVALLVVIAATFFLTRQLSGSDDDQADPGPSTPAPTQAPTTSTPNGLAVGDATIDLSSATKQVGTQPRGFPQTPAGAVEAFTGSVDVAWGYTAMSNDDVRAYLADAMPDFDPNTLLDGAAERRAEEQLDETGQFIGPEGQRSYQECLPQYGAYRQNSVDATAVEVEVWMPCISGVGSPENIDDILVVWTQNKAIMRWTDGDWRYYQRDGESSEAPVPQNKNRPDVSFTERAQILGTGWNLYQGGTQEWPSGLLGPEPSA